MSQYDLLIKGGRVICPESNTDGESLDLAVTGDRIVALEKEIPESKAKRILHVNGKFVVPGLIDIHAHVFDKFSVWAIPADPICTTTGVTTVVDAGTSNWVAFDGFRKHIVETAKTEILAFIHISRMGLMCGVNAEMFDISLAEPEAVAETINKNRDIAIGVKVRQGVNEVGANGVEPLKMAIKAAEMVGLPVMCHITECPDIRKILELLRPGDIATHCFHNRGRETNAPINDNTGKILPEVLEARKRGIIFDVAHGGGSFHRPTAMSALEQGFLPDVISTDLHIKCVYGPTYDLTTTMSKFLSFGMSMMDIVKRVTITPAKVIGREKEIGHLKLGSRADIAVLEILNGDFKYVDSEQNFWNADKLIQAPYVVRNGQLL